MLFRSGDKAFKLYPGMWHALSAELPPDAERVYSDIISWLDQRANRATCSVDVSENIGTMTVRKMLVMPWEICLSLVSCLYGQGKKGPEFRCVISYL